MRSGWTRLLLLLGGVQVTVFGDTRSLGDTGHLDFEGKRLVSYPSVVRSRRRETVALPGDWPADPWILGKDIAGSGFSLGNHRVEVAVDVALSTESALYARVPWRRRHLPAAATGSVVGAFVDRQDTFSGRPALLRNMTVLNASADSAIIAFQPQFGPGRYDFYYLPYNFSGRNQYYHTLFRPATTVCSQEYRPAGPHTWQQNYGTANDNIVLYSSGQTSMWSAWKVADGVFNFTTGRSSAYCLEAESDITQIPCAGWNAATILGEPEWVVFDLRRCIYVDGFALWSTGDRLHDPMAMSLEAGTHMGGNAANGWTFDPTGKTTAAHLTYDGWRLVANFTGAGVSTKQEFTFRGHAARYWRWAIHSRCCHNPANQAFVREIQFRTLGTVPQAGPSAAWLNQHGLNSPTVRFEHHPLLLPCNFTARTEWDAFTIMEEMATAAETAEFVRSYLSTGASFAVIPEYRENAVRDFERLPHRWYTNNFGARSQFSATVTLGEFFTWQIAIVALHPGQKGNVTVTGYSIAPARQAPKALPKLITCFNLEGVKFTGNAFRQNMTIAGGSIGVLWWGLDASSLTATGDPNPLAFTLSLSVAGEHKPVDLAFNFSVVRPAIPVQAHGDHNPVNQSRLRWLNSRIGYDGNVSHGYVPLQLHKQANGTTIQLLGRDITVDALTGLPRSIVSNGQELLSAPMRFGVHIAENGTTHLRHYLRAGNRSAHFVTSTLLGRFVRLDTLLNVSYEGYLEMSFSVSATAVAEVSASDISLDIPLKREAVKFFMGFDRLPSGKWSGVVNYSWANFGSQRNRNGAWLGKPKAGIRIMFTDTTLAWQSPAEIPTTPPETWGNCVDPLTVSSCQGNVTIDDASVESIVLRARTGPVQIRGDNPPRVYTCDLLVTPVKPIDLHKHFNTRLFELSGPFPPTPDDGVWFRSWEKAGLLTNLTNISAAVQQISDLGANWINVFEGSNLNQWIDYPLREDIRPSSGPSLEEFVTECHRQNLRVKLYFSTRTLSSRAAELFALKALPNHEILFPGTDLRATFGQYFGGSWLQEHLVSDYALGFERVNYLNESHHYLGLDPYRQGVRADESVLDTGFSRMNNFYAEAVGYTISEYPGSDGLYLDGIAYDKTTLERVRKVIERAKGSNVNIDIHAGTNNRDSRACGFGGPALHYMAHMPWADRLWFGEGLDYWHNSADWWLLEASGIPYGLMGDMIREGAAGKNGTEGGRCPDPNRWLGMVFAMTARIGPGRANPEEVVPLWDYWTKWGLHSRGIRMIGWWEDNPAIYTNDEQVKATTFLKPPSPSPNATRQLLVAVGNFGNKSRQVAITADNNLIGGAMRSVVAQHIDGFQPYQQFVASSITVDAKRGWLLEIDVTPKVQ